MYRIQIKSGKTHHKIGKYKHIVFYKMYFGIISGAKKKIKSL